MYSQRGNGGHTEALSERQGQCGEAKLILGSYERIRSGREYQVVARKCKASETMGQIEAGKYRSVLDVRCEQT